ncbi:regulatory protein [Streptomyces cyaneogriseus subsp. noncyanogenus]|uniref:Regulatory protein n=1 Tax=Streptomyces cyaneogriseus subsp. noncyanogenus TaxID=477245 RepID=A0A0C5FKQ6_9ACTN|nr:AfsR/SARP family transcriptional regulator [Streptomyces cyaneogriseus]AJP00322.1 regulatory protein [Streptomyces cyaneogriseus subsp. noncyanogenus]
MQFRILGPVEIQDERTGLRILPTGAKQRALLGALVVKAGREVSVHRLIDELWGDDPPANAANALQAHVARLRRRLPGPHAPHAPDGPDGREGAGRWGGAGSPGSPGGAGGAGGPGGLPREWIATRSLGYVLHLGPAGTDAQRFHALAAQGRQAAAHDPARAVELLRESLSLWRGPALEGSTHGDICAAEAAQLEEHRITALETMYDASLRAGRHGEVTGELEELTTDHPMRERFHDLLMVALYRCGRQAEALNIYDRVRRRLVRELGVEPGPALRGRMEAILRQDPVLALSGPPARARLRPLPDSPGQDHGQGQGQGQGQGEAEATVLSLGSEIASLHHRIEGLRLQQEQLVRRFEQLTATAGDRVAGL